MTPFALLDASLLDLLYELRDTDIHLIVGGGYGLYLKQRSIRELKSRTLIDVFPEARSTNDLDIFLRTELLADVQQTRLLADALNRLGCEPVDTARYYQFARMVRRDGELRRVKFDLLTGPPHPAVDRRRIKMDERRLRPRAKVRLHGRVTLEAVGIEEDVSETSLRGDRTTGEAYHGRVFLPQPFTYAVMKLFAFRDQKHDSTKEYGQHHALDLYTTIAMITESEWEVAQRLSRTYRGESAIREAVRIVQQDYSGLEALGLIRLREHPLFSRNLDLDQMMAVLADLFPGK